MRAVLVAYTITTSCALLSMAVKSCFASLFFFLLFSTYEVDSLKAQNRMDWEEIWKFEAHWSGCTCPCYQLAQWLHDHTPVHTMGEVWFLLFAVIILSLSL